MQILKTVLDFLNQIPPDAWGALVQVVVSAIIVSPLALALKKWWKVNSEKIMLLIVSFGSVASAIVVYLMGNPDYAPWVISVTGAVTFATTQPVYYLFVKPIAIRVGTWFATQVSEAAKLNEAKSAELPASGLPIGSDPNKTV